jgi:YggT family protein
MAFAILQIISILLNVAITVIIVQAIRKIMPDFGAIDLTPMVVIIGIIILQDAILPPLAQALLG